MAAVNWMLKVVARQPGSPPKILARRFESYGEMETSINNIAVRSRHIQIRSATRISRKGGTVIHAEDRFKRAA